MVFRFHHFPFNTLTNKRLVKFTDPSFFHIWYMIKFPMICNTSFYIFSYFQTPFAHNPFLPCIYNSGNDTTWGTAVCFWPFSPLVLLKVHDMHWFWKEEVKTCELVYYLRKYVPLRKTKMSKLPTCMLGKQKIVKIYVGFLRIYHIIQWSSNITKINCNPINLAVQFQIDC